MLLKVNPGTTVDLRYVVLVGLNPKILKPILGLSTLADLPAVCDFFTLDQILLLVKMAKAPCKDSTEYDLRYTALLDQATIFMNDNKQGIITELKDNNNG